MPKIPPAPEMVANQDATAVEPAVVASASPEEAAVNAQLITVVERLIERIDRGDREAVNLFQQVLAEHGDRLKQTLSPENKLHPDVSDYNPDGERDHPRPPLAKNWFFLGVPLDRQTLTKDEILLLNSFAEPKEMPAPNGRGTWRVAFLRNGNGGEIGYISVPFQSFDDLRGLEGGWQRVCRDLLGRGTQPVTNDTLMARIAAMEAQIKALTQGPVVVSEVAANLEPFDPDA